MSGELQATRALPAARFGGATRTPPARERVACPDAVLSRSDLRELGYERRAIDAIFRACPVVALPGYSRSLIRVADYRELVERSTYAGERVRPIGDTRVIPLARERRDLQVGSRPGRANGRETS